jgi:hypothetical protein
MPEQDREPRTERTEPTGAPCDELILAAVDRAARHRARDTPAVPVWAILDHLALPRRSAGARHVRSRLNAMHAAGLLESARRHGIATWELTRAGQRRLQSVLRAGELPALPESPQHRAWRNAHTTAGQEIERFRMRLREQLHEAALLLDADPSPSDDWFELADTLQRAARRVASASHCLYEWIEPDDAIADLDDGLDPADEALARSERVRRRALRAGRRNVALWDEVRER